MASVQHGHSHGDLHDDESLLDDDLIEADDGECLVLIYWLLNSRLYFDPPANLHYSQLSRPTTPYVIPTQPLYEAILNPTRARAAVAPMVMATT